MKKIIFLSSLSLIFICCKSKVSNEIHQIDYYPSKSLFNASNLRKIKIAPSDNAEYIVNEINHTYRKDSIPFLEFKEGSRTIQIIPIRNDYGMFRKRNSFTITTDSVYLNITGYPKRQISELLKIHYENKGRDPYLSEGPEKAVVEIELDAEERGRMYVEYLKNLVTVFDKINAEHGDSLKLRVALGVPLPSPPKN